MKRILLIVVLVAGLASLVPAAETGRDDFGRLAGRAFVLETVDGKAVGGERPITLEFGENERIFGSVCNRFTGGYAIRDGLLVADTLASTRMLCLDEELGKLENTLLRQLGDGVSVTLHGDTLTLRRDATVWTFVPSAAPAEPAEPAEPADVGAESAAPAGAGGSIPVWSDLAGRKFTLATVNGEAFTVTMGRQPFISFDEDGRVFGSACNNFNGAGDLTGGTLTIKNAASTLMMCIDPALSTFERDFHKLVRDGAAIRLDGGALTLSSTDLTCVFEEQ